MTTYSGAPGARTRGIAAGKFWSGAVAAALVTGLTALVVTLIVRVFGLDPLAPPWLPDLTVAVRFAVLGFVATLLAAVLLYVLSATTPGGETFFGWIVGLLTLAAAVLPFAYDAVTGDRIATSVAHLAIGLPILGLLPGVASRATVWK
ncbi:DUF6069 family protein [Rhodococcus tukisamuensis]|uniref:Uncharacterized protein n=1 Tax=Rhodococcus tukisamuensis TaxID=168276 RepID=A0A1G6YD85_9NOCA|nr:DUF6069 family protein [Rhodococcus tukisamuensis]SDD87687.1 hypothetical protein SAMN05444580_107111 [Rhodococcus tukisamuensis]